MKVTIDEPQWQFARLLEVSVGTPFWVKDLHSRSDEIFIRPAQAGAVNAKTSLMCPCVTQVGSTHAILLLGDTLVTPLTFTAATLQRMQPVQL